MLDIFNEISSLVKHIIPRFNPATGLQREKIKKQSMKVPSGGGSTAVEHLAYYPKIEGLNHVARSGGNNIFKKFLKVCQ